MLYTSYLGNKILDWLRRGQAYTPATANFSVGLLTSTNGPRVNSTAYALNATISLTANDTKTHLYKCTTAGTTRSRPPTSVSPAKSSRTALRSSLSNTRP